MRENSQVLFKIKSFSEALKVISSLDDYELSHGKHSYTGFVGNFS